LLQAAKAWAYLENRDYVVPDDIQHVFPQVVKHRLLLKTERDRSVDPITMLLQRVDMLSVL